MASNKVLSFDVGVGTVLVRAGNQGYKGAILTSAAVAATLTIYDNGAGVASGTILEELKAPAEANEGLVLDQSEIVVFQGITVVITGAGAKGKVRLSLDRI